jgi:hypothetical protein
VDFRKPAGPAVLIRRAHLEMAGMQFRVKQLPLDSGNRVDPVEAHQAEARADSAVDLGEVVADAEAVEDAGAALKVGRKESRRCGARSA